MKIPKIFRGFTPNPTRLCPRPPGGLTVPPIPQLIIATAARSFSQIVKKTNQLIFSISTTAGGSKLVHTEGV